MPVVDGKQVPDYKVVDGLVILPSAFSDQTVIDTIKHKPNPGDIFVATFPKCGTTWTQQILYLLLNDCKPANDAFEFLSKCPYLEFTGVDALDTLPPPRLAKIHLPYNLAPMSPDAKYVFVVRNPKDCLVSFFHHSKTQLYDFADGTFDVYFDLFMNGQNDYGDYFDHILSWYEHRNDANVLFLYYEKMKKDIKSAIIQIGTFLGPKYQSLVEQPDKLADLIHYSSFEFMKKHVNEDMSGFFKMCMNPDLEISSLPLPRGIKYCMEFLRNRKVEPADDFKLVRKGVVGDWKVNFTDEQNKRMNEKIEQKLKGTELLDYWKSVGCL